VKKYYYTADKQIRLIYDFNVEQEEQWWVAKLFSWMSTFVRSLNLDM
jgi:hypothetical protein